MSVCSYLFCPKNQNYTHLYSCWQNGKTSDLHCTLQRHRFGICVLKSPAPWSQGDASCCAAALKACERRGRWQEAGELGAERSGRASYLMSTKTLAAFWFCLAFFFWLFGVPPISRLKKWGLNVSFWGKLLGQFFQVSFLLVGSG